MESLSISEVKERVGEVSNIWKLRGKDFFFFLVVYMYRFSIVIYLSSSIVMFLLTRPVVATATTTATATATTAFSLYEWLNTTGSKARRNEKVKGWKGRKERNNKTCGKGNKTGTEYDRKVKGKKRKTMKSGRKKGKEGWIEKGKKQERRMARERESKIKKE